MVAVHNVFKLLVDIVQLHVPLVYDAANAGLYDSLAHARGGLIETLENLVHRVRPVHYQ